MRDRPRLGHGLVLAVSWVFGLMLLALALFVAAETVARKLFDFSFQGADELAGYVLAVGSGMAFTIALVERGHVRIDVLHARLPRRARAVLNWLAVVSLAALAVFLAWYCWPVLVDTRTYNSAAATPWATPLIYPQSAWFAAMAAFAVAAVVVAARATLQLLRRDWARLDVTLQPKGAREELADELRNLEER